MLQKYSHANQLNIKLELISETIHIEIMDDGIGFDVNRTSGNGIENMKKRVEELQGKFTITSDSTGTKILATILIA